MGTVLLQLRLATVYKDLVWCLIDSMFVNWRVHVAKFFKSFFFIHVGSYRKQPITMRGVYHMIKVTQ